MSLDQFKCREVHLGVAWGCVSIVIHQIEISFVLKLCDGGLDVSDRSITEELQSDWRGLL